ncbi:MAG: SAM-dependent methyltransferase [Prevotella sp.]|nr:SAM-dependent methyltransferase [Prevotella sp.]
MINGKDILEQKYIDYSIDKYYQDIELNGLEKTWNDICLYITNYSRECESLLQIHNLDNLYEMGLAYCNKASKKNSGQYYTPTDVANVMIDWFSKCDGEIICDVACGTGKLILDYLDFIGFDKARELIADGKVYLYDNDPIALRICQTIFIVHYGMDVAKFLHLELGDFLNKDVVLPKNCKVISNPPYSRVLTIPDTWKQSDVVSGTKELYSSFMEKIILQSKSAVIITPFSFVSGNKFVALRKVMCVQGTGFVVSFDNVPGNIFYGKKHGIFNSNHVNSVRAAITVYTKNDIHKGFRISPLIRFKNNERQELLKAATLEKFLPEKTQIINSQNQSFKKIQNSLQDVFDVWVTKSKLKLNDLVIHQKTDFTLDFPNTCRYFTTASSKKLKRNGVVTFNVKTQEEFNFLYCWLNSSFTYWWWRIYDGGITYPIRLLKEMPLPFDCLSAEDKTFFANMCNKMTNNEDKYIITKLNAGMKQENIKFPKNYRLEINERILRILGFAETKDVFAIVHSNSLFGE